MYKASLDQTVSLSRSILHQAKVRREREEGSGRGEKFIRGLVEHSYSVIAYKEPVSPGNQ